VEHTTWVSLADAAEHVGVTTRTLRRWIAAGTLPAYRVGPRLVRVNLDDLEELMRPIAAAAGKRRQAAIGRLDEAG
jgi:excisionase family DNA binding protein